MIRLFELEGKVLKPTEHCMMIKWLRVIQENHPDNFLKIYAYIFYMTCPSEENPFFNVPRDIREDAVIKELEIDFPLDIDTVTNGLKKAAELYETPTVRAYNGITTMLNNLTDYMETTTVTAGRDGNINSLLRIAKEFDSIRQSYKGVAKDLAAEQETHVRGDQSLGYDQI